VAAARDCVLMDPRHAEARYLLGRGLREQGRRTEAAGELRRALEEDVVPLRAIAELREAVRDVGRERDAVVVDLEPLLTAGAPDDLPGDAWFADHVHPWPEANARLALAIVDALVADGVLPGTAWDHEAGQAAAARHAAALDAPTRARELLRLAFVLGSFERVGQARDRCERAVGLLDGSAAALAEAARTLAECHDADGALAFARRAVAADDGSAAAHTRLGVLLLTSGATEDGRRHLERALALDADAVEARARLGVLLADRGDLAAAEEQFREVLRLRPDAADSHYNLGLVLARRGRRPEAERAFREALRITPDHAAAREQLDALRR